MTERIAFLARTGAGKSGGMRVLFEQMVDAGQFAIFIDPKGDAYGIRAAGLGKGKPVLVMGGDHGDVPLEATAGKVIAEFLVRERVSTVLDISDFGKADMVRFVTQLASTLYQRNRDVVHIFIDEADMVAGEKFYDPKCLEAIQLIQNKGRHRGFGVTVATQRSAIINKTVLYASGTLIAMQTTSPKDVKAVRDYLDVCSTPDVAKEIVQALPTLQTREALVYSPHILGVEPMRITFDSFQTFDSMETPKPGMVRQQPKGVADIDLSAVQRDMAATIEKVKSEDPKLLQGKITQLERELATAKKTAESAGAKTVTETVVETVEVAVFPEMLKKDLDTFAGKISGRISAVGKQLDQLVTDYADGWTAIVNKYGHLPSNVRVRPGIKTQTPAKPAPPQRAQTIHAPSTSAAIARQRPIPSSSPVDGSLPDGERKVLTVAAQYTDRGGATREQIGILTGYARSSRNTYISRLSVKGFVSTDGNILATDAGIAALGDYEMLPEGEDLQVWWLERLPDGEARILGILIAAYPNGVDRDRLSDETGYARSSRNTYISRLSVKRLAEIHSGLVYASADLF